MNKIDSTIKFVKKYMNDHNGGTPRWLRGMFFDEEEKIQAILNCMYEIESKIDTAKQQSEKIDHDIDVRYEEELETAFNKFIEKWCGVYSAHLSDSDENDGEFVRMKIRKLNRKVKSAKQQVKEELKKEMMIISRHDEGASVWITDSGLNILESKNK